MLIKRVYFSFILIFLPVLGFSQTNYTGRVVDADSKRPVSYAAIKIKNRNSGSVANSPLIAGWGAGAPGFILLFNNEQATMQ